jgi:TatA/E family protein of Tat protein translocase
MEGLVENPLMVGAFLGGWEVILLLAVVLILFGAKKLPAITRGMRVGFSQFRKSLSSLSKGLDQEAHDAGESLGGIYGKPAAQALTPHNRIAELYDPAAFHNQNKVDFAAKRRGFRSLYRLLRLIWRFISNRFNTKI